MKAGSRMTLPLDIPSEVEGVLTEAARRQGNTPEQLAAETLRVNFAPPETYPTARQLLLMPEADRSRLLSEERQLDRKASAEDCDTDCGMGQRLSALCVDDPPGIISDKRPHKNFFSRRFSNTLAFTEQVHSRDRYSHRG
jgi:hypothetical protein